MDRGTWWATVDGVAKRQPRLSSSAAFSVLGYGTYHFHPYLIAQSKSPNQVWHQLPQVRDILKDNIPTIPHGHPVVVSELESDQMHILVLVFKGLANLYFKTTSKSPFRVKWMKCYWAGYGYLYRERFLLEQLFSP